MKMKRIACLMSLILSLVFVLSACQNTPTDKTEKKEWTKTFSNCVFGCGADPSIIKGDDGYYYAYVTSETFDWKGDGNVFFSNGPILKSKDLTTFEYAGSVFPDGKPEWSKADNANVWAPDIVYRNGTYYYYYALGVFSGDVKASGIGVATSDYPDGPFVDHGKILDGYDVANPNPIDPFVKEYEGKVYLFYGSFKQISYIELTKDGLEPQYPDAENYGEKKMFRCNLEAAYFFEANGYYYFMGSGGTMNQGLNSSYYVSCYKSKSMFGPYFDASGNNAEYPPSGLQSYVITPELGYAKGVGHNAVIQDDAGDYWIVYHAYDSTNWENNKKRALLIDKLNFDDKNMPYVCNEIDGKTCMYTSSLGSEVIAPYIIGT